MGGYGREDICAAAMISGVSVMQVSPAVVAISLEYSLENLPAAEYAPDALEVLYGLGCEE
jgi:hypothetical protein